MPVLRFSDMTWHEVRDADLERAVAILPIGAVEAHGPHMPLGTDVIIAEGMARACAEQLDEKGVTAFLLPALWYTAARFASGFPGTVAVEAETVRALIGQIAGALRGQGIGTLALANAHLDPEHVSSLRMLAAEPPDGVDLVFLDITRRAAAMRLTEEFRTGACHAGRFEGSIVRAEAPHLFRDEIAAGLAPNPASLSESIRDGATSFEEAGGPDAYFGWPAEASAEEGRETLRTLGAMLAEAVLSAGGVSS